jgi:AcrR family transcriptional regulator
VPNTRTMRSDARRNYELLLAAAVAEVARTGADASLEKIARDAGVGSATLHRHFPSRQALLEAVFHDRVEGLCAEARELAGSPDPGRALADWLRAVAVYGATTRGLAASLLASSRSPVAAADNGRSTGATADSSRSTAADNGRSSGTVADNGRSSGTAADSRAVAAAGDSSCEVMLKDAGGALLRRAQAAGDVRPQVAVDDLLMLVNAVSLATEDGDEAERLVTLALDGIHPPSRG